MRQIANVDPFTYTQQLNADWLAVTVVIDSAFGIKLFALCVLFVAQADVNRVCLFVVAKLHRISSIGRCDYQLRF